MDSSNPVTVIVDGSTTLRRTPSNRSTTQGRLGVVVVAPNNTLALFETCAHPNVGLSHNEYEYLSVVHGLSCVTRLFSTQVLEGYKLGNKPRIPRDIKLLVDSELVCNQMLGEYATRKEKFRKYQKKIKEGCRFFSSVSIQWHSRESDLAVVADYATRKPEHVIDRLHRQYRNKDISLLIEEIFERKIVEEDSKKGKRDETI